MKREIKFRLWDDESHKWFIKGEDGLVSNMVCCDSWDMFDPDDYGWCQYTGLHDKNGREIYEGDIVRVQETMDGGRIVCIEAIASVIWNSERGCWGCDGEFEGHLADYAFGTVLNFMGNVCEVVGNIHENPELLEAEK